MNDEEFLQAISDIIDKKNKPIQEDIQTIRNKVVALGLTIENETNKNIQLLAENHMNLIDKLNQAIRVSDKTLLYEVQVSTLKSKVEHLENEIQDIKNRIDYQ